MGTRTPPMFRSCLPIPLAAYPAKWHTVFTDGSATSLSMGKKTKKSNNLFLHNRLCRVAESNRAQVYPPCLNIAFMQQESHKNPLSANRLQAVFTDSCRLHTNIINKYITYDLSIYTFIHNPCHPSRHAKPSSSHCLQRQANLQGTHTSSSSSRSKSLAIQASCVKSFHLFIFSLKCSPLSWHPSLKRQPHIHSAHIAQPSHLMSHSPSTQPQSCHNH